jgi:hypothetical protein
LLRPVAPGCATVGTAICATVGTPICATVGATVGAAIGTTVGAAISAAIGTAISTAVLDAGYARGAAIYWTDRVRVRVARYAAIGTAVRATVGSAVLDAWDSFVGTGVRGALQVVDAAWARRCFAHRPSLSLGEPRGSMDRRPAGAVMNSSYTAG